MNEGLTKIKDIVLQVLSAAFILFAVFYSSSKNYSASVLRAAGDLNGVSSESIIGDSGEGYIGQEVVSYGQLRRFSTSGELSFNYYDIDKNKPAYDNPYIWFWVTLPESEDYKKIKSTL